MTNRVKQGCLLAPTLCNLMFSAMLTELIRESNFDISIKYRCDGKLFKPRSLLAVTKVKQIVNRDLLFADNCALNKNKAYRKPIPLKCLTSQSTGRDFMQAVDNFTYLGSAFSRTANVDAEVTNRIAKASRAFGRLLKSV